MIQGELSQVIALACFKTKSLDANAYITILVIQVVSR